MSEQAGAATFRELDAGEIEQLLLRGHVGRLAFVRERVVDIEPLHYVYRDGWIWGRTSPGTKLTAVMHEYWVAFQVDEVESPFSWRSAVVHGGFYVLDPDAPADAEAYARGLSLLREVMPEALTPADPTPHREVLFRIAAQEMAGRAAEPRT
jgi:uncharacterized protein